MMNPIFSFLGLLAAWGFISGCSTCSLDGGYRVKSVSGDGLKVVSVECRKDPVGLRVHGRVETQANYLNSPFHFLEVQLVDAHGEILDAHQVAFYPNPIVKTDRNPGRATYCVQFTNYPPVGGLVVVSVDGLGAY